MQLDEKTIACLTHESVDNMNKCVQLEEKTIDSKQVFDGTLLKVFSDTVSLPNGGTSVREYIKHFGAVCIVPVTDDEKIVMEHQFRYAMQKVMLEIPAGKLDSPDEDPLEAAKRELKEETGYTADKWAAIGSYFPSVAYTTERIWMFMAQHLHGGERHLDPDEFLTFEQIPLCDVVSQIMDNKINDGKTVAAVLKVARLLNK